ncbi:MAG: carboxypeptidase-like regulatory domain-containing protein [Bacteroidota bacterium]
MATTILLIILLAFPAIELSAQADSAGSIIGKVEEYKSGKAVDNAGIELLSINDSAVVKLTLTDSNGFYKFSGILPGTYLIRTSHLNYNAIYSPVFSVSSTIPYHIEPLVLKPNAGTLDEVIVKSKRPSITLDGNKMIIKTTNIAGSATGNALELLKAMPGIIVDNNESVLLNGKSDIPSQGLLFKTFPDVSEVRGTLRPLTHFECYLFISYLAYSSQIYIL